MDFITENKEKPFCIYVAHEAPHDPYQGPGDPPVRILGKPGLVYDHREPDHAARAYKEMMVEMDKGVGEIMTALKKHQLDEDTFVMFFSDNGATGPGSCGPYFGRKGTLWEGGHRVPGIARWPGKIPAGTTSRQLASTIDVMPTLLDIANVSPSKTHPLDGTSLLPWLTGGKKPQKRIHYWQYGQALAVRDGNWRLILNAGKPPKARKNLPNINWSAPDDGRETLALFDLPKDPGEQVNLAQQKPGLVKRMSRDLKAWHEEVYSEATPQPSK